MISVIITVYNSANFIRDCLESLKRQTYRDFEVIIVDNDSSDNSLSIINKTLAEVILIKNKINLGYCRAINQGIQISHGEFILCLNPDIILDSHFLEEALKCINLDPRIGSVSGKLLRLLNGKPSLIIDTTGHIMEKSRTFKNRGAGEIDVGQYNKIEEIFGVCGAAPLYRKAMLEDIRFDDEYLDEDFYLGYDDADIDWRTQRLGWKALYTPYAIAHHIRSASVKKISRQWAFYNYRNRYLMILKNDSLINQLLDFFPLLIYESGITFSMLLQFQFIPVLFSVFKLIPRMQLKREYLIKKQKVPNREIRKWFR